MIAPWKIFGRLGNSLFQYAFLLSYAKDHDLDFYFQDECYFKENANAVRALFSSETPEYTDKVAIHVRRGDYVNNSFYVDLMSTDYYQRAMAMFPKEEFLVFSDDIEWCKEQDIFSGCEFYEGTDELDDLNKMASCKAHIIANSSFSWWGAWLSPDYPNSKVVAPKMYYTDGKTRTVFPDHWKKI